MSGNENSYVAEEVNEFCLPWGEILSSEASSSNESELSALAILRSVFLRGVAIYCSVSAASAVVTVA
jgi:hypothetical protein